MHPNPETIGAILDKQLAQSVVVATNLYNTGLLDPTCAIAYRAASMAGANAEQAWNVAHHHYLFILRDRLNRTRCPPRRDDRKESDDDLDVFGYAQRKHAEAIRSHEEGFAEACALVNPFSVRAAA